MKNGKKHHLEIKKPTDRWGGYRHIHLIEMAPGKSEINYFDVRVSSSQSEVGYSAFAIPEEGLLELAFFLFDVAEKNGLVPSADKTAAEPAEVAAPAVAIAGEAEVTKPSKSRRKSKKKTAEISPGDEVISSSGYAYTYQGIDDDGWKILTDRGRRLTVPPSYSLTKS